MKRSIRITLFFTIYFLLYLNVFAASPTLYFEKPTEYPIFGKEFSIKLLIDSNVPLNAYEVLLSYPEKELEFTGFDNSNSIIDVWQTVPAALPERGLVKFVGGGTKPFLGSYGELLTIKFKPLKVGEAKLGFNAVNFYLANGEGTEVHPEILGTTLTVLGTETVPPSKEIVSSADDTPPDIKFLAFIPDPFNQNQKILGYAVSDSDSGVKDVLARSKRSLFSWSDWQRLNSPVALVSDVWAVEFKAIDNANNAAVVLLYDWGAFLRILITPVLVIFAAVLSMGFFINFWRKRRGEPNTLVK